MTTFAVFPPSMHENKEYAYSPDLSGRIVKGDQRGGKGSLLHSLSKEPDFNSLCNYTWSLNYLKKKKKKLPGPHLPYNPTPLSLPSRKPAPISSYNLTPISPYGPECPAKDQRLWDRPI